MFWRGRAVADRGAVLVVDFSELSGRSLVMRRYDCAELDGYHEEELRYIRSHDYQ
jgi:hypothetical protein